MWIRRAARLAAEVALVWLAAACTTAAFAPRGTALDAHDQMYIPAVSMLGGLVVALPAVGVCAGLWWLLSRQYLGPLALASAGLMVLALLLPRGMTVFFLPPPIVLLATSWVLVRVPEGPR